VIDSDKPLKYQPGSKDGRIARDLVFLGNKSSRKFAWSWQGTESTDLHAVCIKKLIPMPPGCSKLVTHDAVTVDYNLKGKNMTDQPSIMQRPPTPRRRRRARDRSSGPLRLTVAAHSGLSDQVSQVPSRFQFESRSEEEYKNWKIF
jgi:hypothetical protein